MQALIDRMDLREKLAQLTMADVSPLLRERRLSPSALAEKFGQISPGCIALPEQIPPLRPHELAEAVNVIQSYVARHTRLGIAPLIVAETLHGLRSFGATIFPQSIALASTWDPALVRQVAQVAACEGRAVGVHQALAPDLDLARDPRWGRVEETYGEDPYLVEQLGVAYIEGMQGAARDRSGVPGGAIDVNDGQRLLCTVKHFAAHGTPEGGINLGPVAGGMRELHTLYLPPFKAAIQKAGALAVMPAYSELDGLPAHASSVLLRQILRQQWAFEGFVLSDYEGVEMLHTFQRTAASLADAARQALLAGVDIEAPNGACYGAALAQLFEQGILPMELLDAAVMRVLHVKRQAGLLDRSCEVDAARAQSVLNAPDHRKLARHIAAESIVLLKNDRPLLPLPMDLKRIAVIGPNADVAQLGDYTILKPEVVSPLQGIRDLLAGGDTQVVHARGCTLTERCHDDFAPAVEAARDADVAIVCVGGTSHFNAGVGWGSDRAKATCGEGFDLSSLRLAGAQEELVQAIHATGTPTVVVLIDGRPSAIEWTAQNVPAIVVAWYAGEEGGRALADVLFGRVNPCGKLPISFPRSAGHVPCFYNHKPSARGYYKQSGDRNSPGRDYVFSTPDALFPFGHGLSYTTFEYSDLHVSPKRASAAEPIHVSVNVRNAGDRFGKEVVQLYVRDCYSSVTTPVRCLRRFEKVPLDPGQLRTVRFVLGPDDLQLLDAHFHWRVEPGDFELIVGPLRATFAIDE